MLSGAPGQCPHQRVLESLNLRARGTLSCPQTSHPCQVRPEATGQGPRTQATPAWTPQVPALAPLSPHIPVLPAAPRFRQGQCPFPPNEPT